MEENKNSLSDHDLLIENSVLLKELIRSYENHLRHHWAITVIALSAGLIGAVNMCIGLLFILTKGF